MGELTLEGVFRQDEEDGLCGKAERAGVEYVLPSHQAWSHEPSFAPESLFLRSQFA